MQLKIKTIYLVGNKILNDATFILLSDKGKWENSMYITTQSVKKSQYIFIVHLCIKKLKITFKIIDTIFFFSVATSEEKAEF